MGKKIKGPAEMLEGCFSNQEWEFLKHHKDFKTELKKGCKTLDDFELLSTLGARILLKSEVEPNKVSAPSVHPRKGKRN
jgi:hypothetical protein